jgi:hypothetical protein
MIEKTLSFNPETGTFTFDSFGPDSLGVFRIPLADPQVIAIDLDTTATPGLEFAPTSFSKLLFNNSGSLGTPAPNPTVSPTRIEIPVIELPSRKGVLGFVLAVKLTRGTTTVHNIETPPFLVTPDQPFPGMSLLLSYDLDTGVFRFTDGGEPLLGAIALEKGLIVLRLHDVGDTTFTVSLAPESVQAGIVFADSPVAHPQNSDISVERDPQSPDTIITITRDFISGVGVGLSFGVKVPLGNGETCTVYSPDPIIIDKQIGSDGG